jgi:hypothetical protein
VQTDRRCVERMNRLYEEGADDVRIGDYVRRWSISVQIVLAQREFRLAGELRRPTLTTNK